MKALFAVLALTLLASIAVAGSAPKSAFKNLQTIADSLSIDAYSDVASKRTIKIAILDNGFADRDKANLPAGSMYHAGPVPVDPKNEEKHGTYMAQLVTELLARTPDVSYELHLYSAYGYTNLKTAIDNVIANKFDIVLYAQVWEYGGNVDGRGFINTLVTKATDAGLIWINASGNFGNATYTAPVEILTEDWAHLPSPNRGVRIRCLDNKTKKCQLRAVLSWNDFKDNADDGTEKDLDFVLSDDTLKVIRTGGLQQVLTNAGPGQSLYPREIVEGELTPGTYELRVKARSKGWTKADTLRIVTSGDYVEQVDTTTRFETLLAPADNAGVITVGASDSEKSGASRAMGKPEFKTASEVRLTNGDTFKGSSNSAAMTAALAVIARAQNPNADRTSVLSFLREAANGGPDSRGSGNGDDSRTAPRAPRAPTAPTAPTIPGRTNGSSASTARLSSQLGFAPTGPGCYSPVQMPLLNDVLKPLFAGGAVAVQTTAGVKVFTAQDPWSTADLEVEQTSDNDMLVATAQGVRVVSRSVQTYLANGSYEVLEAPADARICR